MKLKQLSVFLENKPGQILTPTEALSEAGISIATLCLADTEQFGILRMIIEDHERAKRVLEEAGCVVNECEVLAVEIPDRAGGLTDVLEAISGEDVNLEYMYAFSFRSQGKALLVFRFDEPNKAVEIFGRRGIGIVDKLTLFREGDAL